MMMPSRTPVKRTRAGIGVPSTRGFALARVGVGAQARGAGVSTFLPLKDSQFRRGRARIYPCVWARHPNCALAPVVQSCPMFERTFFVTTVTHSRKPLFRLHVSCVRRCRFWFNSKMYLDPKARIPARISFDILSLPTRDGAIV